MRRSGGPKGIVYSSALAGARAQVFPQIALAIGVLTSSIGHTFFLKKKTYLKLSPFFWQKRGQEIDRLLPQKQLKN